MVEDGNHTDAVEQVRDEPRAAEDRTFSKSSIMFRYFLIMKEYSECESLCWLSTRLFAPKCQVSFPSNGRLCARRGCYRPKKANVSI